MMPATNKRKFGEDDSAKERNEGEKKERNEEERKEEDEAMKSSCSDDETDDSDLVSESDFVDDSEEMPFDKSAVKFPPEWEAIEKSPQYLCGLISRFVKRWGLENQSHIPDSKFKFASSYKIDNLHEKVKRRIQAIRDSRGYDVEPEIPYYFLGDPFTSGDMDDPEDMEDYNNIMKFVLEEINLHAQAQSWLRLRKLSTQCVIG